jgi:hypothetical protein
MKHALIGAVFLSVATIATSAFAVDVGGNYTVYGTNFDGSHYKGTATIKGSSSSCTVEWETGSTSSSGICILSGSVFAAAYQLGKDVGLAVYDVRKDGTLDGVWSIEGQEGSGTEILTPAD